MDGRTVMLRMEGALHERQAAVLRLFPITAGCFYSMRPTWGWAVTGTQIQMWNLNWQMHHCNRSDGCCEMALSQTSLQGSLDSYLLTSEAVLPTCWPLKLCFLPADLWSCASCCNVWVWCVCFWRLGLASRCLYGEEDSCWGAVNYTDVDRGASHLSLSLRVMAMVSSRFLALGVRWESLAFWCLGWIQTGPRWIWKIGIFSNVGDVHGDESRQRVMGFCMRAVLDRPGAWCWRAGQRIAAHESHTRTSGCARSKSPWLHVIYQDWWEVIKCRPAAEAEQGGGESLGMGMCGEVLPGPSTAAVHAQTPSATSSYARHPAGTQDHSGMPVMPGLPCFPAPAACWECLL